MINGRVDHAKIGLRVAADMGEQRILAVMARPVVVFHVVGFPKVSAVQPKPELDRIVASGTTAMRRRDAAPFPGGSDVVARLVIAGGQSVDQLA